MDGTGSFADSENVGFLGFLRRLTGGHQHRGADGASPSAEHDAAGHARFVGDCPLGAGGGACRHTRPHKHHRDPARTARGSPKLLARSSAAAAGPRCRQRRARIGRGRPRWRCPSGRVLPGSHCRAAPGSPGGAHLLITPLLIGNDKIPLDACVVSSIAVQASMKLLFNFSFLFLLSSAVDILHQWYFIDHHLPLLSQ